MLKFNPEHLQYHCFENMYEHAAAKIFIHAEWKFNEDDVSILRIFFISTVNQKTLSFAARLSSEEFALNNSFTKLKIT